MSTLNLEHNATKKTNLIGHSYSGKQQLLVKPSLCEQITSVFFNPVTGGPAFYGSEKWCHQSMDWWKSFWI